MSIFPKHRGNSEPFAQQWAWLALVQRYGYAKAQEIVSGKDEPTNTDIAAWNNLGGSRGLRVAK